MIELFIESIALYNLPVTLLLGLVVFYWLLVLVGVADSETEPMDVDGDGIADVSGSSSGFWPTCGRFLHLGQVPLSVVGSFLALSLWMFSVLGNYFFNGEPGHRSLWMALLLLLPNLALSLIVTRIVTSPFRRFFNMMEESATEVEAVLDREGEVTSRQVDERYGQVSVHTGAAPLLVNARVEAGALPIPKGAAVRVIGAGPDHAFYYIQPVVSAVIHSLPTSSSLPS